MTKKEFIERFIKDKNLTKNSFCRSCGISVGSLNRIYYNNRRVKLSTALKVVKILNIKLDDFIKLDD
ncbi:MAG: helix-turn-helix transcriptional regulator [Clostridia bacterium]|nr:helix-turn-helix transcriptional regulator [Clostridia bacterium]MBQ8792084.1 helix-turn-helix transcriptional regulator [Clostridia bacterium]